MTPCPLCLLGFKEPHTREDWLKLAEDKDLQDKLHEVLAKRQEVMNGNEIPQELCY